MTRNEKVLCTIYAVIAGVALIAVWANIVVFMRTPENRDLWVVVDALYANYAAAAFTNDLIAYGIVGCIFMVVEGNRLKMRYIWLYVVFSLLIAISVMFPIFLIVRQINISKQRQVITT